jgi:hypothetical protein
VRKTTRGRAACGCRLPAVLREPAGPRGAPIGWVRFSVGGLADRNYYVLGSASVSLTHSGVWLVEVGAMFRRSSREACSSQAHGKVSLLVRAPVSAGCLIVR